MRGRDSTRHGSRSARGFAAMLLGAALAAAALLLSGCAATLGGREVFFRVGQRTPPIVHESASGERIVHPGLEPEGRAVLLFFRGRL